MKTLSLLFAFGCLFLSNLQAQALGSSGPSIADLARMAPPGPPEPPAHNPHPPQSAEDKRRVDFAVAEIRAYYGPGVELLHPHVIPWSMENFLRHRRVPEARTPGEPQVIVEAEAKSLAVPFAAPGAMAVGPALQADEYMVHVYARFRGDPAWYHLDVILTEDAAGQPMRRRFFRIPMPPVHGQLPPGVVC